MILERAVDLFEVQEIGDLILFKFKDTVIKKIDFCCRLA